MPLSAPIAGIFAVIYWLWYPDPYFRIKGVSDVVWVLAGINFARGAVLTYILYKPGKKGLKFEFVKNTRDVLNIALDTES